MSLLALSLLPQSVLRVLTPLALISSWALLPSLDTIAPIAEDGLNLWLRFGSTAPNLDLLGGGEHDFLRLLLRMGDVFEIDAMEIPRICFRILQKYPVIRKSRTN